MARIKYINRTEEYKSLRDDSADHGEMRDCSVIAVAAACGVTYQAAHAALKAAGRKDNRGATVLAIEAAVESLGFFLKPILPIDIIAQYEGCHGRVLKSITTHHPHRKNAVGRWWKNGRSYILITESHAAAVVDGVVHDWTSDRAFKVRIVFEVLKKA